MRVYLRWWEQAGIELEGAKKRATEATTDSESGSDSDSGGEESSGVSGLSGAEISRKEE